jgi:HEAT repeat protein
MTRSQSVRALAWIGVAVALAGAVAVVKSQGGGAAGQPPPVTSSTGARLDPRQLTDSLRLKATLKKGLRSVTMGYGRFGPNTATRRTYAAHLEIENRSGHTLETGTSLYLVETALKPPAGGKPSESFEVAGGYFRQQPVEDFVGAAVFREPREIGESERSGPDREEFGFHNVKARSASGGEMKRLGPMIEFTIGAAAKAGPHTYGQARTGETLSIDEEIELAVMVRPDRQDTVVLVSPRLIVGNAPGPTVSFRYLVDFEPRPKGIDSQKPDEGELALVGSALLPITEAALMPVLTDTAAPLWKRIFVAQWASLVGGESIAGALSSVMVAKGRENDALRASAILGLGANRSASSFDRVLALATDKTEGAAVQSAAVSALGRFGDNRATPVLISIANSKDEPRAREAIGALAHLEDPRAVDALMRVLEDNGRSELHAATGSAVGRLGDESSLERLQRVAADKKARGGDEAVRAIGRVGTPRAVDLLAGIFQTAADDRKKTVCAAFGTIDRPEALAALRTALRDTKSEVREAAVDAIAAISTADRVAALRALLVATDEAVQKRAVEKLAEAQLAEAAPEISALALNPAVAINVREAAANALGRFKSDASEVALIKAIGDPAAAVRTAAIRSLRQLQVKRAGGDVVRALKDINHDVRSTAASALAQIGDRSAHAPLVDALLLEKDGGAVIAEVSTLVELGYDDLGSFPQIAARLRDVDRSARFSLTTLLKHLTGEDIPLAYDAKPAQVEEAIRKWIAAAQRKGGK